MKKIISFPHIGNYHIPIEILLKLIFKDSVIMPAPKTTKRTLELGSRYSPDFVCVPFKYNLGNYIEALENGANVLIQAGGGCRYGYYAEIQELILRDLGYEFKFVKLIPSEHVQSMQKHRNEYIIFQISILSSACYKNGRVYRQNRSLYKGEHRL